MYSILSPSVNTILKAPWSAPVVRQDLCGAGSGAAGLVLGGWYVYSLK